MDLALVALWYGTVLLLAGLAAPVAAWLFPDWPDRGLSLAPAIAFGVLTLAAFWVGQLSFGPYVAVAGLLVLFAAALATRTAPDVSLRAVAAPLAVFSVAFAAVLVLRGLNPAISPYAGEQFLDFGLIHAVRRADALPPVDIWFAGERLRYYFGGPLLAALLTWLTDTSPNLAYNLLLPTLFATLATAAYGVASAVAAGRDLPRRTAGVLGAFLVAFGGPLATAARGLSSYLPRDLAAEYGRVLYGAIRDSYANAVDGARFLDGGEFSYWLGRYIVPDAPNVFPSWTYVNGDLRPHMYAGPFLLLAVGLALAYYRSAPERTRRRQTLLFGGFPAVAGLLALTNTFDLPAAVGLAWLTVFFADGSPRSVLPMAVRARLPAPTAADGGVSEPGAGRWLTRDRVVGDARRALAAAGVAAVVAVLAVAWASPYLLFHTAENEGVALLGPTSNLGGLLLVWGAFLGAFALAVGPLVVDGWGRRRRLGLAGGLLALVALTTLLGNPALGLFGPLVLGGWWLVRSGRAPGFEVVLVVAGAGLLLVPELAYAKVWPYDPNAPRWNTVYKIAMQVWVLWGVAAAVALARVFGRARNVLVSGVSVPRPGRRTAGAVLAALLLVTTAFFPFFALWSAYDPLLNGQPGPALSLDGTAYLDGERPDQMAAVEWLRTETTGQPTMVSKPTDTAVYTWDGGANLPATFSGVPTLAGWEHAAGYHGREAFAVRVSHVEAIYQDEWAVARNSLRQFDVRYIYQGPVERAAYGQREFAEMSPAISVAYENPTVTIYAVDQAALAGAAGG
jgi:YYY domain-containing protein